MGYECGFTSADVFVSFFVGMFFPFVLFWLLAAIRGR